MFDPNHVLEYEPLQLQENLAYEDVPIQIINQACQVFRTKFFCEGKMKYPKPHDPNGVSQDETNLLIGVFLKVLKDMKGQSRNKTIN